MEQDDFRIGSVEDRGGVGIIYITQKRLTTPDDGKVLKTMVDSLIKKGQKKFIISLRDVDYMTSSILGTLISIHKDLEIIKGSIKLSGLNPMIRELFTMTQLNKVFKI